MTDIQTEKAFQKQDGIFLNSKKLQAKKTSSGVRFFKKVGLGKYRPMCALDYLQPFITIAIVLSERAAFLATTSHPPMAHSWRLPRKL